MNKSGSICVFDTGAGGLSVLAACRAVLPRENFIYFADTANAPYGNRPESEIRELTFRAVSRLAGYGMKALVIACNTATGASAACLRSGLSCPAVGLEPALKPAVLSVPKGKKILVLCTAATARQERFLRLMKIHGRAGVEVAPQKDLARLVEDNLGNLGALREYVRAIFAPRRENLGGVVLGCTHYVLLRELIADTVGKNVPLFDGNAGAARRLKFLLTEKNLLNETGEPSVTLLPPSTMRPVPKEYYEILRKLER